MEKKTILLEINHIQILKPNRRFYRHSTNFLLAKDMSTGTALDGFVNDIHADGAVEFVIEVLDDGLLLSELLQHWVEFNFFSPFPIPFIGPDQHAVFYTSHFRTCG